MNDVALTNNPDYRDFLSTASSSLPPRPSSDSQLIRPMSQPAMATSITHNGAASQQEAIAAAARPAPLNGLFSPFDDSPTLSRPNRKRTASISVDEVEHPRFQGINLYTPSSTGPFVGDESRELICLCTKAPKVPRPRNAFILYRQHYQAQVARQHPGLANPEISKLIGEQWREQREEVKNSWKRLAEEEKLRHQRQYPDYRYQPRRGGKGSQGKPTLVGGEDPGRCPKCGGRYIATPRTPSTHFSAATPAAAKPLAMPAYNNTNLRALETDYLHRDSNANTVSIESHGRRFTQPHLWELGKEHAAASSTGPPDKRRRCNPPSNGIMPASPIMELKSHPGDGRFQTRVPVSNPSLLVTGYGPGPLPRPPVQQQAMQQVYRQVSDAQTMQPPLRSSISYQGRPVQTPTHDGPTFDESLRLPPLQTQLPGSPAMDINASAAKTTAAHSTGSVTTTEGGETVQGASTSPRWQFLLKLDMLRAISPPLKPPGPGVAPFETRGAIIAIEGLSPIFSKEVTAVVEKALSISGECAVKIWAGNEVNGENASANAVENNERGGSFTSPLAKYVAEILKWHSTSGEVISYITHLPSVTSDPNTIAPIHSKGTVNDCAQARLQSSADSRMVSASTMIQAPNVPVAVLANGYSLTISDRFAASLSITDQYRAEDHWRWVATLWRGIVGPDLTVYIKQRCSEDEIRANNCVEFINPGVVVLRIAEGSRGVDEKLERRLGFEIMEWVRNGNFGSQNRNKLEY